MADNVDAGRDSQKLPNQIVTPNGMGIIINAACVTRQTVEIPKNTTLNELYDVLADESLGRKAGKDFQLGYYGIGIGGSRCIGTDANGLEGRRVYQHKATDYNAFYPIPFIARKLGEDIDPVLRDNYRMRVVKKVGDEMYVFYYLKLIDFTEFDPTQKVGERDPETGNETERPYIPKKEDLTPKPYELQATNSVPITNTYINGSGKMTLTLNGNDLEEIRNVCRILFNDSSKAAINEMYLAYGIETRNDGDITGGGTVNYKELQSAVVSYLITEAYARDANANSKMPWAFWYGNSLPLLVSPETLAVAG
ncbi:putative major virion structural protein [Pseudomonas phage OBP]|uniref:putative major virion structural protein n=1 Tax=Pseudomonas phage OBP TaxID=1124849 RepID=UPI000240D55C|nr:putative major virion structural protein [Pseudomonas phage OBP]AEV89572.1 putative major virion structural protein [Pseudomonas phage OBP]